MNEYAQFQQNVLGLESLFGDRVDVVMSCVQAQAESFVLFGTLPTDPEYSEQVDTVRSCLAMLLALRLGVMPLPDEPTPGRAQ